MGGDGDGEEGGTPTAISEARFVPGDEAQLERIFSVFCECALLNPDDDMDDDEEEDDEAAVGLMDTAGWVTADSLAGDGAAPALGTPAGNLAHYDRLLAESEGAVGAMSLDEAEGMFDDAEEDEEEGGGPAAAGDGAVDAAEVARRERAAQLEAKGGEGGGET